MNVLRASLVNLTSVVNNLFNGNVTVSSNIDKSSVFKDCAIKKSDETKVKIVEKNRHSNSINECLKNDESIAVIFGKESLPIPSSLVKEQWRLLFTTDADVRDLKSAIAHCKDLIQITKEDSEERRWLVRHLGDLRYALKDLLDSEHNQPNTSTSLVIVVGHHFIYQARGLQTLSIAKGFLYCDFCANIIWCLAHAIYKCVDCDYIVHQKCVNHVTRVCAYLLAAEHQYPIVDICPEIGLTDQNYKCAECGITFNSQVEARLCDYSGLHYCPRCHWNDMCIIPARVIHNWDFKPRFVCRASLQEINLLSNRPVIQLEKANSKLFVFVMKLANIKQMRQRLIHMRKYLIECRLAVKEKLLETKIGTCRHLVQTPDFFSLVDLQRIENGTLAEFLQNVFDCFDVHIRNCTLCTAKAYICEICGNDEVIYPFDDGCILCEKCNSVYHRVCLTRKNMLCPKCVRLDIKRHRLKESVSLTSSTSSLSCDEDPYDK